MDVTVADMFSVFENPQWHVQDICITHNNAFLHVQTWLDSQDEATVATLVKTEGAESVQGLKDSVRCWLD